MLTDSTLFKEECSQVINEKVYKIYTPANIMTGYHMSRMIAANEQQVYSNAGITPDLLTAIGNEIVSRVNDKTNKTALTDVAALANNILYRTKYPVDSLCCIRMGAILSFMSIDGMEEIPDKYNAWWTDKKVSLALDNPDMYTFFLSWGFANTPKYREALDTSIGSDYFRTREEAIRSLMPQELYSKTWTSYITELTNRASDDQMGTNS